MNTFQIILRNGEKILIKAEHCSVTRSRITGECERYDFRDIELKYNYPLYINPNQIDAVIQLGED